MSASLSHQLVSPNFRPRGLLIKSDAWNICCSELQLQCICCAMMLGDEGRSALENEDHDADRLARGSFPSHLELDHHCATYIIAIMFSSLYR